MKETNISSAKKEEKERKVDFLIINTFFIGLRELKLDIEIFSSADETNCSVSSMQEIIENKNKNLGCYFIYYY